MPATTIDDIVANWDGIDKCMVCFKPCKWIELDPTDFIVCAGSEYLVQVFEHKDGSPNCVESVLVPF